MCRPANLEHPAPAAAAQVCSRTPCSVTDATCKQLANFQLRLDDRVLADPRYFKSLPASTLVQSCDPRGPGLLFNSTQLGALATFDPTAVRSSSRGGSSSQGRQQQPGGLMGTDWEAGLGGAWLLLLLGG